MQIFDDPIRKAALDRFGHRCVVCLCWCDSVHHIRPRSSGKTANKIENCVPVCQKHHEWAHQMGSKKSIPLMEEYRDLRLTQMRANANTTTED